MQEYVLMSSASQAFKIFVAITFSVFVLFFHFVSRPHRLKFIFVAPLNLWSQGGSLVKFGAEVLIHVCLDLVVVLKRTTARIFEELSIWMTLFHSQIVALFPFVGIFNLWLSQVRPHMSYRLLEHFDGFGFLANAWQWNSWNLAVKSWREWRSFNQVPIISGDLTV